MKIPHIPRTWKKNLRKAAKKLREYSPFIIGGLLLILGGVAIWATTLHLPDLTSPQNIHITDSTKIYDRTGKIVLFDLNGDVRRTSIDGNQMSPYSRLASVAIEDESFYTHNGIRISSIIRAIGTDILLKLHLTSGYQQGGSTITQQVIKNSLLTQERTFTRKIKEWILAVKLEKIMSKEDILTLYLNTSPYGGNVYGIEEASRVFFGKEAKDLTLPESAYLAALPQAPTYYSPYGNNRAALDDRKNLVLKQMLKNGFIKQDEYDAAKSAQVTFAPQAESSIKAPHFVMFVRDQLEKKYGEDMIDSGGLKVITTLDYDLQKKGEEIAKKWAASNEKKFNAENDAFVAIDPQSGDVLSMIGSRDYFDKNIDGNYNIATAERQPGSSFKPFVYAAAFAKGYRPSTVLFDVPTQFSTTCASGGSCYSPVNYDGLFKGPISLRSSIAESRNVPSVKLLYLVGIKNAISTAESLGITTLTDPTRYGLSLVLGGGEVKLIDMVSAYGVFGAEGVRNPYRTILQVYDKDGNLLDQTQTSPQRVLDQNVAYQIDDVLSDEVARIPEFGAHSPLYFPNREVAVKTGTTNDYRDAWVIGYTPHIAIGAWAGNNDNRSMSKQIAGFIVAPMWNEFMTYALSKTQHDPFPAPAPEDPDVKPIIKGDYQTGGIHSILYSVDTSDPLGPAPKNPYSDPQFNLWETGVQNWLQGGSSTISQNLFDPTTGLPIDQNSNQSNVVTPPSDSINLVSPSDTTYKKDTQIPVVLSLPAGFTPDKANVFINNRLIGSFNHDPFTFSFIPQDVTGISENNSIKVSVYDASGRKTDVSGNFSVQQ